MEGRTTKATNAHGSFNASPAPQALDKYDLPGPQDPVHNPCCPVQPTKCRTLGLMHLPKASRQEQSSGPHSCRLREALGPPGACGRRTA